MGTGEYTCLVCGYTDIRELPVLTQSEQVTSEYQPSYEPAEEESPTRKILTVLVVIGCVLIGIIEKIKKKK